MEIWETYLFFCTTSGLYSQWERQKIRVKREKEKTCSKGSQAGTQTCDCCRKTVSFCTWAACPNHCSTGAALSCETWRHLARASSWMEKYTASDLCSGATQVPGAPLCTYFLRNSLRFRFLFKLPFYYLLLQPVSESVLSSPKLSTAGLCWQRPIGSNPNTLPFMPKEQDSVWWCSLCKTYFLTFLTWNILFRCLDVQRGSCQNSAGL